MRSRHTPSTGPRYWLAITVASVFGANLGDFVSHDLHLGHVRGLPPLALTFAALLWQERRSKTPTDVYYWLAIILVRTAATNLADLATHDLKLGFAWVIAGLTALLVLLLVSRRPGAPAGMPATDRWYWAAMLTAGTLGTALGDGTADTIGLGAASTSLAALLAAVLALRAQDRLATVQFYWVSVVAVRTAGTCWGDLSADNVGLAVSTVASGIVLAGVVLLWRPNARVSLAGAVEPS
jgi:uncharacterized membrane-anchored protein